MCVCVCVCLCLKLEGTCCQCNHCIQKRGLQDGCLHTLHSLTLSHNPGYSGSRFCSHPFLLRLLKPLPPKRYSKKNAPPNITPQNVTPQNVTSPSIIIILALEVYCCPRETKMSMNVTVQTTNLSLAHLSPPLLVQVPGECPRTTH